MLNRILSKLRIFVKHIVEKSPVTLNIAEFFLVNCSFFLPHDNDYYGFLKIAGKDSGLFLDVGANDGRSALSFHKLKKNWSIFSIEANPLHIPQLKKVKSRISNFDFIIRAVDRNSGKDLTLYTPVYHSINLHASTSTNLEFSKRNVESMFSKDITKKIRFKKSVAKTIRIDDLKLCPDIIKMDIEGGEMNALLGCVDTIKRCRPYFLVEYHDTDFKEVMGFFRSKGYASLGFDPKRMGFTDFSEGKFKNCFFMPEKSIRQLTKKVCIKLAGGTPLS